MNFLINLKQIKTDLFKKSNIYFLIIIFLVFATDRASKFKIISSFSESTYHVNNYINFDLIWNLGIGFGFLSTNSNLFYNFVTLLVGSVLTYLAYILVLSNNIDKFILSIIVGGALGNFYDRIIYKAVPDFIDIHYNNFHWFTFNVADIFITIGIVAYVLKSFFIKN